MEQDPVLIFRFEYPTGDEYCIQQGDKMSGAIKSRLSAYNCAVAWADNGEDEVKSLVFFHEDAVGQKGNHFPDYTDCVPTKPSKPFEMLDVGEEKVAELQAIADQEGKLAAIRVLRVLRGNSGMSLQDARTIIEELCPFLPRTR